MSTRLETISSAFIAFALVLASLSVAMVAPRHAHADENLCVCDSSQVGLPCPNLPVTCPGFPMHLCNTCRCYDLNDPNPPPIPLCIP